MSLAQTAKLRLRLASASACRGGWVGRAQTGALVESCVAILFDSAAGRTMTESQGQAAWHRGDSGER